MTTRVVARHHVWPIFSRVKARNREIDLTQNRGRVVGCSGRERSSIWLIFGPMTNDIPIPQMAKVRPRSFYECATANVQFVKHFRLWRLSEIIV